MEANHLKKEELVSKNCYQSFRFGPELVYQSDKMYVILGMVEYQNGRRLDIYIEAYLRVERE